jgi:tetratricopeptide (TPR) repeat protein
VWSAVVDELPHAAWSGTADLLRLRCWLVNNTAATQGAAEAIELGQAVLEDCGRLLGEAHRETWRARNNLAGAYEKAGEPDRACNLYRLNLRLANNTSTDVFDLLLTRENLGGAHLKAGRFGRAIPMLRAVLTERSKLLGDDHPDTLATTRLLGVACYQSGDRPEAIRLLERAAAGQRHLVRPNSVQLAETLGSLAQLYTLAERADDALAAEAERVQCLEEVLPRGDPSLIEARATLADRYLQAGRYHEATKLFSRNLADIKSAHGDSEELVRLAADCLTAARRSLLPPDGSGGLAGGSHLISG